MEEESVMLPTEAVNAGSTSKDEELLRLLTQSVQLNTTNATDRPSSTLDSGLQTPTTMTTVNGGHSSTSMDLLAMVSSLTKKVDDQQNIIVSLLKTAVNQQIQITALEKKSQNQATSTQFVDTGTWKKLTEDGNKFWPVSEAETRITFSRTFKTPPKISVALNLADVGCNRNLRLKTYATEVDTTGFTLHADMWGDTMIYGCGISWFAIGEVA